MADEGRGWSKRMSSRRLYYVLVSLSVLGIRLPLEPLSSPEVGCHQSWVDLHMSRLRYWGIFVYRVPRERCLCVVGGSGDDVASALRSPRTEGAHIIADEQCTVTLGDGPMCV